MGLDEVMRSRSRLEEKANQEIQRALDAMHGDLEKTNEMVAEKVKKKKMGPSYEPDSDELVPPEFPEPETQRSTSPLIFLSYSQQTAWADDLFEILVRAGYLVFDPWKKLQEQIGQKDVPFLDAQPLKVVKSICPTLQLPDEVLLSFEQVSKILQKGDMGDNYAYVFKSLWFLVRSSLMICDLSVVDAASGQNALYAKQLGIPLIGVLPTSGQLHPWMHRVTTALFSSTDLLTLLPMIQGYAPLVK